MHHCLLVASPLVVVCLVLPAVPATAQSDEPAGCTVLH